MRRRDVRVGMIVKMLGQPDVTYTILTEPDIMSIVSVENNRTHENNRLHTQLLVPASDYPNQNEEEGSTQFRVGDWVIVNGTQDNKVFDNEVTYVIGLDQHPDLNITVRTGNVSQWLVPDNIVRKFSFRNRTVKVLEHPGLLGYFGVVNSESENLLEVQVDRDSTGAYIPIPLTVYLSNRKVVPQDAVGKHYTTYRDFIPSHTDLVIELDLPKKERKISALSLVNNFFISNGELTNQNQIGKSDVTISRNKSCNAQFCVIFDDDTILWNSYKGCHSDLKDVHKHSENKAKFIVTGIQVEDDWLSDEQQGYYDWLFNDSPWSKVFKTKSVEDGLSKGVVLYCKYDYNLVCSAAMATRYGSEDGGAKAKMWASLCYAGLEHNEAFALLHLFSRQGFSEYVARKPHPHDVLSVGNSCLSNFINDTPSNISKKPYRVCKTYDCISGLWGDSVSSLSPDTIKGPYNKAELYKVGRSLLDGFKSS